MSFARQRIAASIFVCVAIACGQHLAIAGECGCQMKYAAPTCKGNVERSDTCCSTCRHHHCRKCALDRCPPQGAVVSSMPAMFVAPLAFAQPANFVTVQNQPTMNLAIRAPETQSSINVEDLRRALQNALDQQKAQQSVNSCNKSGNGGQAAMRAPVPPGDDQIETRVKNLEDRLNGLETKVTEGFEVTNANLTKVLSKLQGK